MVRKGCDTEPSDSCQIGRFLCQFFRQINTDVDPMDIKSPTVPPRPEPVRSQGSVERSPSFGRGVPIISSTDGDPTEARSVASAPAPNCPRRRPPPPRRSRGAFVVVSPEVAERSFRSSPPTARPSTASTASWNPCDRSSTTRRPGCRWCRSCRKQSTRLLRAGQDPTGRLAAVDRQVVACSIRSRNRCSSGSSSKPTTAQASSRPARRSASSRWLPSSTTS